MKKKKVFSRIAIWGFLLSPMFVSCTQNEIFDESCMYSTNASRFSGANIEITHTVSKEGNSTSDELQVGKLPIKEIYGTMKLSWPGGLPFSLIGPQIKAESSLKIVATDKYRCISTTKSRPSLHDWVASATCTARIVYVSFTHSAQIETTEAAITQF